MLTLDEDIFESEVELESEVVEPDYDAPPKVMGDPSVELTEQDEEAAQVSKSKAMDALFEGRILNRGKPKMLTLDEDIIESEVELESEVVEPDYDAPPKVMGDPSVELTEQDEEAAQVSKSKAMDALFEDAIILNPKSAVLCASRASIFVKLKKPNAAIRDADVSLLMKPDSAKGYQVHGMAKALLGLWEEAARDLCVASKLDFDEETSLMLKREAQYASILRDGLVIGIASASNLETKLDAAAELSRLAIVYFSAKWCGPCCYVGLAAKYPKVMFLKVDNDEARDAAFLWKISSIPSFYLSKERRVVDSVLNIDMNSLEKKNFQLSG
ncbi:Thioredoxin [Handroanthus impetiginosus]|uniref:Thioredoxin n=1 Tax=Handroanthus impetiginosus TaxID=429701 RepID=A0A2G9I706_9LAMI|nr:Thioredoxin [Handroanthus impetiginosus]